MRNPFKQGSLYAFYYQQLTRLRPPTNEELEARARAKFPKRAISRGAIRVFRSKLRAGTLTGNPVDVLTSKESEM